MSFLKTICILVFKMQSVIDCAHGLASFCQALPHKSYRRTVRKPACILGLQSTSMQDVKGIFEIKCKPVKMKIVWLEDHHHDSKAHDNFVINCDMKKK